MTPEQIRHARDLLTRTESTVASIATLLDVSRNTIYKGRAAAVPEQRAISVAEAPANVDLRLPVASDLQANILATFAEFEVDLPGSAPAKAWPAPRTKGKLRGKQPKLTSVGKPSSPACTPPANTPSPLIARD